MPLSDVMASVKLSVSSDFYRKVMKASEECAREAAPVIEQEAHAVVGQAIMLAPRDTGFLASTGDVGHVSTTKTSAAVTGGFNHPQAGAIHEGYHWGRQTVKPPPHFLRKAAKASRQALKAAVARSLANTINRLFPGK
jgi:hypothetical protein